MEELILNSKNVNIDIKNSQCKIYQLNDKTKEHISTFMGLPFDGIPLDDEHILTLEQVDKELDKITNEQRLLLKK